MSVAASSRALVQCQHTKTGPSLALYNVFVKPAFLSNRSSELRKYKPVVWRSTQCRTYKKQTPKAAPVPEVRRRRNEEIKAWTIQLVDVETGKLSEPTQLGDVLRKLDLNTHRVEEVKPGNIPVCKIIDKKKEVDNRMRQKAEKRLEKKLRGSQNVTKTFEINWAIDNNDLSHRLARFRDFLEDGYRVEIVLANKKRGRLATMEERKSVLSKLRAVQADVRGSRESKPMEGDASRGVSLLFFQGRPQGQTTAGDESAEKPEPVQQIPAT